MWYVFANWYFHDHPYGQGGGKKKEKKKEDEKSLLKEDIVPLMFNVVLALNENTSMDKSIWMLIIFFIKP
jgi:hypothetical protein